VNTDFNELVEASRMAHNRNGVHNLWKAAISLPEWFFVADGHDEDAEPIIGAVDRQPHVIVFTDQAGAEHFSTQRAAQKGGEPTAVLTMPVADAVAYFEDLSSGGVEGALFNSGEYGFRAGLMEIRDMYARYTRPR